MKFSAALILAALPLLAAAAPRGRFGAKGQFRGGKGGNRGGNKGQQGGNKGAQGAKAASAAPAKATTAAAANNAGKGAAVGAAAGAATGATAAGGAAAAANNAGKGAAATAATGTQDAQTSLTLDPAVLATSFFLDGLANATPGQVASLTSKNNFINFCKGTGKPITNGAQIKTGSCNPAPMGIIAATTNMPSAKFQFPTNGGTVAANTAFNVQLKVKNIELGNFVNAQASYFAGPQQVNAQGNIIGHTHVVIEAIDSLASTTLTDPTKFAFFKGVDQGQDGNGVVSVAVAAGLPDGFYRMTTINSSANHAPVAVAVAQHGSTEDCVYFTVGKGGKDAAGEDAAAQAAASALAAKTGAAATAVNDAGKGGAAATAAAATATKAAAAAAGGAKKAGQNKGQQAAKGGKFGGGRKGGKRFSRE
jgi:hypothetical protein